MQCPGMPLIAETRPLNWLNFACVSAYSTFRPLACAGRRFRLVHGSLTGLRNGASRTTSASAGLGIAAIARPLTTIGLRLRNGLGSVLSVGSTYQFHQ